MKARPSRVLVIEDDWDILEVLKLMLEDEGHHVVTAKDGRAGLDTLAAAGKAFDVVVMDISMPGLSGIEVAQALRADAKTADVRIAIHTALDEHWVRARFSDYDLFLTKAHDADVMIGKLATLLEKPRSGRDAAVASGPLFSAEDVMLTQRALRAAMGLGSEALALPAFVALLGEEIDQLRRLGRTDEEIARLVADAVGKPVSRDAIRAWHGTA